MIIEYTVHHENVWHPKRENPSDAGLDVFFSPEDPNQTFTIQPGECQALKTGLSFGVPHGYVLEVKNRSSMSSKKKLLVGGGVVDAGYEGEVSVVLHNIGNDAKVIKSGDKIAQVLVYPIVHVRPVIVDPGTLYKDQIAMSKRSADGFGSTGSSAKKDNG